jgi:hypothetical protein
VISYESQATVDRPPETVFPFLIEPAKQALWSDVPMRVLSDGPLGQGSRMELTFGKGPISARIVLELTAVELGRLLSWKTVSGPIDWTGAYRLVPAGASATQISQQGAMRFTGLWRLLEPLVGAEIKGGELKELEKLKAVVEAA